MKKRVKLASPEDHSDSDRSSKAITVYDHISGGGGSSIEEIQRGSPDSMYMKIVTIE